MNRINQPSPALIVAVLALVAALAGTAVAEVATTAKLNKKEKKQTRKIARKQINKLAPGLSVANADNATNAENAENATNADTLDNLNSTDFRRSNEVIGANALGTITERSASNVVAPGALGSAGRQCEPGEQVLTGGNDFSGSANEVAIVASRFDPPNGWRTFLANNAASGNATVTVRVYCLEP